MTTYNTGNPIGSTDPRDLYDNAENLDNFSNGTAASYTDRLGVTRRSLAGIDATADSVLNGIGYAVPVAYASGISLTLTSQTVDYNGVIYAPMSSALPFTTSSWGTDSAKLRAIQVTDADLITYTPSGTGAVVRTAQDKMREWVSVKDFGAVGDGVADDTAAIQAALDSGALNIFIPSGEYRVKALKYEQSQSLTFIGQGASSILRIIGTDADAYSYTIGTSTISANILFNVGGEAKPRIGNFTVIGNTNVSYGMAIHKFFRGSVTENIWFRDFQKAGAVPITYHNCVSTHAPNIVGDRCSRFIRIHGMADAVHFVKPTIYNYDIAYAPIFNEIGYLTAGDPNRYTVGTIFDGPYGVQDTAGGSVANPGYLVSLTNSSKGVIRDVWAEGVDTAVHLTSCEKFEIHGALSAVSSSGSAKILLTNSYNNIIFTEGAVELNANSIENTIFTKSRAANVTFSNALASKNLVIAKDELVSGKVNKLSQVEFTPTVGQSTGLGTPVTSILNVYQEGTFVPQVTGSVSNPTVTYSEQSGKFQRIGNVVYFSLRVRLASISGGSGELRIAGLPFFANGGTVNGGMGETHSWTSNTPNQWRILVNNSYLNTMYSFNVNQISDLGATTAIRLTGFYFTA